MEAKSGSKFLGWLVGLLVLCNIALLVTIWIKPKNADCAPGRPPVNNHRGGPGGNFNDQLSFTKEQNDRFIQMRAEQHEKIDSLKKLAKDARELFFAGLKNGNQTPAQLDSLGTVLGNYHKLIELQTYSHFKEVKGMLTDVQKPLFDSIITDVLRSMPEQPRFKGDGMRRGGPPGDRGHRPPPPPGEMEGPPPPGPGE